MQVMLLSSQGVRPAGFHLRPHPGLAMPLPHLASLAQLPDLG